MKCAEWTILDDLPSGRQLDQGILSENVISDAHLLPFFFFKLQNFRENVNLLLFTLTMKIFCLRITKYFVKTFIFIRALPFSAQLWKHIVEIKEFFCHDFFAKISSN